MDRKLKCTTKTIQLIKEISQLCDFGLDSDFLAKYQKHVTEEEFGIHQNAELSPFKEHNQKSENTSQRMDKNTYKPISKRFIFRIYEEYL